MKLPIFIGSPKRGEDNSSRGLLKTEALTLNFRRARASVEITMAILFAYKSSFFLEIIHSFREILE